MDVNEILVKQIEYLQDENKRLLDLVAAMVIPAPIVSVAVPENKAPERIESKAIPWSRRRQELERQDRIAAQVNKTSPHIAVLDSKLEELQKVSEELEEDLKDASR